MIWICLHGWGSSARLFEAHWTDAPDAAARRIFLDGLERDPMTDLRRWFPFSGQPRQLAASLAQCAPRLEALIEASLPGDAAARQPIGILGHSQGGMLALALALRQRLPIAAAHCYAGYLPEPFECEDPCPLAHIRIGLYSSAQDGYVPPARVAATAARLRRLGARNLEHHILDGLPHAFSPAWLRAAERS